MPTSLGCYEAQPDDTDFGEVPSKWLFLSFSELLCFAKCITNSLRAAIVSYILLYSQRQKLDECCFSFQTRKKVSSERLWLIRDRADLSIQVCWFSALCSFNFYYFVWHQWYFSQYNSNDIGWHIKDVFKVCYVQYLKKFVQISLLFMVIHKWEVMHFISWLRYFSSLFPRGILSHPMKYVSVSCVLTLNKIQEGVFNQNNSKWLQT